MSENIEIPLKKPIDIAQEQEKPRLISILFFDFKSETPEGKLNLLGVFDQIYVDPEEKRTPPFGLFVRTRHTFDAPINVVVFDPKGKPQGGFSFSPSKGEIPEPRPPQMQVLGLVAFNAPIEGLYWFDVSYNQESIGGAVLQVEFRKLKESLEGEHK